MAKSALDDFARNINEKYLPQLIEHDWDRQIGVVLYGKVFQLKDKEYALGIVTGIFEDEPDKQLFKLGQSNTTYKEYEKYLDIDELIRMAEENAGREDIQNLHYEANPNIATLLETHLDSTQILPDGRVYKIKRFIASTGDLRVEVYPKDHYPAHFHVISDQRGINARFDIKTLDLINIKEGKIKSNDIKKIKNFFETHPEKLNKLRSEYNRLTE
jgi:hypothetical protein